MRRLSFDSGRRRKCGTPLKKIDHFSSRYARLEHIASILRATRVNVNEFWWQALRTAVEGIQSDASTRRGLEQALSVRGVGDSDMLAAQISIGIEEYLVNATNEVGNGEHISARGRW